MNLRLRDRRTVMENPQQIDPFILRSATIVQQSLGVRKTAHGNVKKLASSLADALNPEGGHQPPLNDSDRMLVNGREVVLR